MTFRPLPRVIRPAATVLVLTMAPLLLSGCGGTPTTAPAPVTTTVTTTVTAAPTTTTVSATVTAVSTVTEQVMSTVVESVLSTVTEQVAIQPAAAPIPLPEPAAAVVVEPDPEPASSAYYANCSEARAAGAAPLHRGDAGYRSSMDRDGDGVACE